jgi:hypothetical protein
MAQYDFGTIDPNTKSGTALATDLNSWRSALHSTHSGATAPSYLVPAMLWADTTSANYELKMYDGAQWITVAIMDATNNTARVAVDSAETSYITSTTSGLIKHVIAGTDTLTVRGIGLQFNIASPAITDSSNNEYLSFTPIASAVNYLTVRNAATATNPAILAAGTDANVGITLTPKGTGRTNIGQLAVDGTTITATAAQLNFVTGVTSAIQTQLNAKAPLASPTFTGQVTAPAGSAAAPGLVGTNTDTGIFMTTVVAFSTAGAERVRINNAGAVSFNSAFGTSGDVLSSAGAGGPPVWVTPPLSAGYVSANQTITSAGLITLAHGLGLQPKLVLMELVCITAEAGFAVNDVIMMGPQSTTTAANRVNVFEYNATNINVRYSSNANCFVYADKTTGAPATLTNTSWRLRVRAFA